jgi:hypothetical protein
VVFYADNFDRGGNAELIGTGTQPWVGFPGLWITTAAGELQRVGATATVTAAVLGPCATNDQEATATILTRGGAGTVGVICRAGAVGSGGYAGRVSSSGQWLIAGGSGTLVTETTGSYANGDRVTLRCVGSVLTLLVNGVVKLTTTDTTIPTGSYVGVRASSGGTPPRFDLFTGGDFPPPTQSRTAAGRLGLRPAATRRVVRPRTGTVGLGARPAGRRLTVARAVATVRLGLTPAGRAALVRRAAATVGLGVTPAARTGLVRAATARAGLGLRPATPGLVVRFSRGLLALFGAGPTGTVRRVARRTGTVRDDLTERGVWSETDLTLARTGLHLHLRAVTRLVRFVIARLPVDPDLGGRGFPAQLGSGRAAVILSPTAVGAPLAVRTAGLTLTLTPAASTRGLQYDRDVTVTEMGRVTEGRALVLGEVRAS